MFQTFELIFFLRPQTELKSEASKQVKSPPSHQPPPPQKKKKNRMNYLQDEGMEKRRQQEFLTTYRNA